ncbi:MAG: alpha/beta fold hydrolase, partial [Betaproteobacteria bacterium]
PGFGYSTRPGMRLWTPQAQARLLAKACLALDVINPVVVGHSMGTQTAFEMAIDPAYSVRGIVVISGYYFPTPRVDALILATPAIPVVGHVLRYTVSNLLARLAVPRLRRRFFWPRKVEPAFVDAVPAELMVRPWQLRASAEESAFMVPAAARLAHHYDAIDAPVEIFGGADERVVGQRMQSRRLHEAIPHSHLHLLPGEGHMLHYQVPEQIVEAIDRVAHAQPVFGLARRA